MDMVWSLSDSNLVLGTVRYIKTEIRPGGTDKQGNVVDQADVETGESHS